MVNEEEKFNFKFGLGDMVKHTITDFVGIVSSCTKWISNCNTYGVKPIALKDGIPQNLVYLDEPVIKIVKRKVHAASRETGGPTPTIESTTHC